MVDTIRSIPVCHQSAADTARKRESQANKSWEGKLERLEKQVEELTREKEELEDVLVSTEERMKEAQEGKVAGLREVVGSIPGAVIFQDDFESSKNNEIDTLTETLIGKTGYFFDLSGFCSSLTSAKSRVSPRSWRKPQPSLRRRRMASKRPSLLSSPPLETWLLIMRRTLLNGARG